MLGFGLLGSNLPTKRWLCWLVYSLAFTPPTKRDTIEASVAAWQAHEGAITSMRYTHNENWLVTSDSIGRIKYWKGRNELVKVPTIPLLHYMSQLLSPKQWPAFRCLIAG